MTFSDSAPEAREPSRKSGPVVVLDPPRRIHDSRNPNGGPATKIKSGEQVLIGFGLFEPAEPQEAPVGPALAGAFINLTVTQTVGAGFLTVHGYLSDAAVLTSNVNWTTDGQTIANSSLVPVGAENLCHVICTGGEAHFIIDLQGYVPYEP